MSKADDTKAKLRKLRDQLAWETPRAQSRGNTPPALVQRLSAAAEMLNDVCRFGGGAEAMRSDTLDELYEDALVEGHLALHEWERWRDDEDQQKRKVRPAAPLGQRRQHERHETSVTVSLTRHGLRTEGSAAVVGTDAVRLSARNISLGGILVMAAKSDLPRAAVGSVVHVTLGGAGERLLHARAVVARRDDAGIGLRWLTENEADRRVVDAILAATRPAR
ncbi:MAG TPA: PilZ domain-containing protein [Polyangia bacterium]